MGSHTSNFVGDFLHSFRVLQSEFSRGIPKPATSGIWCNWLHEDPPRTSNSSTRPLPCPGIESDERCLYQPLSIASAAKGYDFSDGVDSLWSPPTIDYRCAKDGRPHSFPQRIFSASADVVDISVCNRIEVALSFELNGVSEQCDNFSGEKGAAPSGSNS